MITIRRMEAGDDLSAFFSGNDDLDSWVKRRGLDNQYRYGVTYLALDEDTVVGFVTISASSVEREEIRSQGPSGVPVLLLGRMAVAQSHQQAGIGRQLLTYVFQLAYQQHLLSGCAAVVVDSKPEAEDFYKKYGFKPIRAKPSAAPSPWTRMFIAMKAVLSAIGSSDSATGEYESDADEQGYVFDERQLFIARWPDGSATLLSAGSMREVAALLDEIADPGQCELVPFKGQIAIDMRLAKDPKDGSLLDLSIEDLDRDPRGLSIVRAAYPTIHRIVEESVEWEPSEADWQATVEREVARELTASAEWRQAVASYAEALFGAPSDRTAALRQMEDVSIPGEPKPTTPEQQAWFETEQRRVMDRVGATLRGQAPPRAATETLKKPGAPKETSSKKNLPKKPRSGK